MPSFHPPFSPPMYGYRCLTFYYVYWYCERRVEMESRTHQLVCWCGFGINGTSQYISSEVDVFSSSFAHEFTYINTPYSILEKMRARNIPACHRYSRSEANLCRDSGQVSNVAYATAFRSHERFMFKKHVYCFVSIYYFYLSQHDPAVAASWSILPLFCITRVNSIDHQSASILGCTTSRKKTPITNHNMHPIASQDKSRPTCHSPFKFTEMEMR